MKGATQHFFLQVNLHDLRHQLNMLREHPVGLEDLAAPEDPAVRVVLGVLEVQEARVDPAERPRLFQEKLLNQLSPQRNLELPEVLVDRTVPVGPVDPVVQEVREALVVQEDREGLLHLVLEKRPSQLSQQRDRVSQVVQEVPMDPVDQGGQEDQAVLEVPGDQVDPEVLEGRVVQEGPEVQEALQQSLQERQPKRQGQPKTHPVSQVDPVDQMVREVLEDPVVRGAQVVPGDQEDREVTYQNTLHFPIALLMIFGAFFYLSNFSIQFSRFHFF